MGKAEMNWISVDDRLPMENVGVLITDGKDVTTAVMNGFKRFFDRDPRWKPHGADVLLSDCDIALSAISHWMSLPEPPSKKDPDA